MHPPLRHRCGTLWRGRAFRILPFDLFRTLRDLIVNHLNFHSEPQIARISLKSLEERHPSILELFSSSLPNTREGCHQIHLRRKFRLAQECLSVQF